MSRANGRAGFYKLYIMFYYQHLIVLVRRTSSPPAFYLKWFKAPLFPTILRNQEPSGDLRYSIVSIWQKLRLPTCLGWPFSTLAFERDAHHRLPFLFMICIPSLSLEEIMNCLNAINSNRIALRGEIYLLNLARASLVTAGLAIFKSTSPVAT